LHWLLSNNDFRAACGENADWMIDVLWENGVICEEDARFQFIMSNTDYDAPDCPFCGANDNKHYEIGSDVWKCKKCLRPFTITSRRYIDNTKLPLTHWWRFSWLIGNAKKINTCAIARDLDITQKTAWIMLDRLKQATKDSGIELKNGVIEFKNTWEVIALLMKVRKDKGEKISIALTTEVAK
jgi:hypothetical protein